MFTKKVSTKSSLALVVMAVFVLLLQSVFILPAPSASALTPAQEQACYEKLNGYKEIIGGVEFTPPMTKEERKACVDAKICSTKLTFIDTKGYNVYTCKPSAATAEASKKASDLESASLIQFFCGSKPSDTTSSSALRYSDCSNDVKTAYAKCKYTGGSTRSSITDTPENITSCLIPALKTYIPSGMKPDQVQKAVLAAVVKGQTDAANLLKTASSKKDCEDKGGAWEPSQDPPCVTSAPDTTDECPLPDDTSMRWLGCSIMSAAQVATDKLYGAIQNFLYTPTDMIFGNANLKKGADSIRNLAIGLILIAGLIMVIAQATGSEIVDAYTIRKLLPRIGVAVIGIALAWPLLRFAITFINDLGLLADRILIGVTGLGSSGTGSSNDLGTNILSTIFGAAAAGGVVLFLGTGVIALAGTIMLALLLGLLVLAIRQLVIMVCVMIAPLAIAAYVLPGTQKLWNFWQNTLTTALLMFPIIMFFLASGKAFASVLGGANTATSSLLAIIVFIAPYFLLPFAFKLAGGLMSTVFSIANDRNRGMFDRLKKSRQNSTQKNLEAMKHGNRFRGDSWASQKFNRTTEGMHTFATADKGLNPRGWRSAMQSHASNQSLLHAGEYGEKNEAFQAVKANDDLLTSALRHRGNYTAIENELRSKGYSQDAARQGVAAIRLARRDTTEEVFDTAAALALPGTGTAFKGGAGEMHQLINEVAGGDRQKASRMLAAMRSGAVQARRFDLGGGSYGAQLGTLEKQNNGTMSTQEASRVTAEQALNGQGGGYIVGSRNGSIKNFAPIMLDNVKGAAATGDIQKTAHELAILAGRYDAMGSVAPENADFMAHEVLSKEISYMAPEIVSRTNDKGDVIAQEWSGNYIQKTASVRQAIEDYRGQANFQEMRREYQSAAVAGANAAAAAGIVNPPEMGPPATPTPT